MFVLVRAVAYAAVFVGLVLVFVPARILSWAGVAPPRSIGILDVAGMVLAAAGGVLALSCVLAFAWVGKGTPAPFDPPRRLVVRGPYRCVRNPMYIGAGLALTGAAVFFRSPWLLGFAILFLAAAHVMVVAYEEPTLRRTFGSEYEAYCRKVGRWRPRR